MRARATGTKSFIIAATSSAFPTGYSGITALRWRRPMLYEQLRTPQYASPRPSISPPSLYVLSAAAAYITGPSKFFAISVSGVSGPKFPRKTQSALQPAFLTSSIALSMSSSFSTVTFDSYRSFPYAFAIAALLDSEREMMKQSRLTAIMPSFTSGMFLNILGSLVCIYKRVII